MPKQVTETKTQRREFLKQSLGAAATLLAGQVVLSLSYLSKASALTGLPLDELLKVIPQDGSLTLIPSDKQFATFAQSFNRRTQTLPQVRVVAASAAAVAAAIAWARKNNVPFATRSGGHSYEGYSQSHGLVIDVRLLKHMSFDQTSQTATFGSGCSLGDIYSFLAKYGMAIPAGSCPPVGVAGHTLGGGFGFLARKFGLACDNVESFEIVDAEGRILTVDANQNQDLNWALRGGGNGNFGIVTQFKFNVHAIQSVSIFSAKWLLKPADAAVVASRWQDWAPHAPDEITSIFRIMRAKNGLVSLSAMGLSTGSLGALQTELAKWTDHTQALEIKTRSMPFLDSVKHFGGSSGYESVIMKAKSDYAMSPMSSAGFLTLIKSLSNAPVPIVAIFDSYGGAIGRIGDSETAFAHRQSALYSIQYYSEWTTASSTPVHLKAMNDVYASMRPFVSGSSYVNYCDLDLPDPLHAYWGKNLSRLVSIKAQVDPRNVFNHAQSLPTAL